jgi:hypothetical protein
LLLAISFLAQQKDAFSEQSERLPFAVFQCLVSANLLLNQK